MATRACQRCGDEVTSPHPDYPYCRVCFHSGAGHHADRYGDLLAAFAALPGITLATIQHTGGGCFGIGVQLADGRFGFMTDAFEEPGGERWCDATLENGPDGLGYLSLWANPEAMYLGETSTDECYGTGPEIAAWLGQLTSGGAR